MTERRADYSKLRPIIKEIQKSPKLDYYLVVTGSHLLKKYGMTINEIKKDGFKIYAQFKMHYSNNDTADEMTRSFGNAVINLTQIIKKLKPDIVFAGFDIGANFASAIVGAHMNIPVVHLEGGEVTGTIDESIRHATSKFAHVHFTTNLMAKQRLVKMGENSKNIFVVGNPSLDAIKNIKKIPVRKLQEEFKVDFNLPLILLIQHTVTSEIKMIDKFFMETINAIKELDIQCLIISGNSDAGSKKISTIIKKSKIQNYSSLPFEKYINLLRNCSVLVGNSSSGIMEAPFLHKPSVNVGTRQNGRPKSSSIISVGYDKNQIKNAIKKALVTKKTKRKNQLGLYGDGNSSKKIIKLLETINLNKISIQKKLAY